MISNKEKDTISLLKNIPVFQGLEENEYREIIPLLKEEIYPPETVIIKEGTHGTSMCIIISGTVKITKKEENKEEIFIQVLYPGSYFGEFSLIDNMPRSANVTSTEETRLFRLEKRNFDELLSKNSNISLTFYKNCLEETFARFRTIISNYSLTQHILTEKSLMLEEINKDLSLARKVQDYFINTEFLNHEQNVLKGIKYSYVYEPCIEIGGDFLNVVELKNGMTVIIIADIMGHGITSALGTGVLKSAFSISVDQFGDEPLKLMRFMNKHFLNVISQLYATCYYALIDKDYKKIKMTKAGHPHPLFWKKGLNDFVNIECIGTGLGLIKNAEFGEVEFDIESGDKVLFFTDGIIEQLNKNREMYSENRLMRVFRELISKDVNDIPQKLYHDFKAYADKEPIDDDVTLLLLEF